MPQRALRTRGWWHRQEPVLSSSPAAVQLCSRLQPAEGTGRPCHTGMPGENSVDKDERRRSKSVQVTYRTCLNRVSLQS